MSHVDEGVLNAYLDGELPAADRAALDAHLAECAACRARLEEERALSIRAGELLGLAQPPEVIGRRRSWRRRVRMPIAWAASVVLALAVGYAVHDAGFTKPTSSPVGTRAPAAEIAMTTDSYSASAEQKGYLWNYQHMQQRPTQPVPPARVRADSLLDRPAAGVVAIQPPAPAVPLPVPLVSERDDRRLASADAAGAAGAPAARASREPPAAAAPSASVSALRGRIMATEWPIIRRGSVRDLLGSEPVGVPGLEVRDIRRSPAADGTILVEQRIDSSTIIQLYQRPARADEPQALGFSSRAQSATERLARYVGGLRVEIAGPLSQDSLNRLLEQLKPLP